MQNVRNIEEWIIIYGKLGASFADILNFITQVHN